MDKQAIWNFIHNHQLCVVATVGADGMPEAAVMGYSETPEFELVLGVQNTSRKYKNLQKNPQVAVVMGWDEWVTAQYEGEARELAGDELERYQKVHFAKMPDAERFKDDPVERYFAVKPKWLRYTDCTKQPWETHELTF